MLARRVRLRHFIGCCNLVQPCGPLLLVPWLSCRLQGSDRAVHNYMQHQLGPGGNLSFALHVRRNWESPVHTTGAAAAAATAVAAAAAAAAKLGPLLPPAGCCSWSALPPASWQRSL